jgi:glycosyltransferase involved in cell wall biosynthesis
MHSPVLSVCIPTYNSSSWLAETLDSLVCQFTEGDILEQVEIIISDNASPDNTRDVVQAYQVKYSNIHYRRNDTNLGGAVNVVKVTDTAHGEYLWLLTDNDSATKFSLSYVLRIIHETHFDVML